MIDYIQLLDKDLAENTYPPAILARVLFLNFLRYSFYGRKVGDYKYNPDETKTEIIIKDSLRRDEAAIGKKPLIYLSRGPLIPLKASMNNDLALFDLATDYETHVGLLTTTLVFYCVGSTDIESELIASVVFFMLQYYKEEILQRGIINMSQLRMDPPGPADYLSNEGTIEAFQTNVQVQLHMYNRWNKRWKTEEEIDEYQDRTGVDVRGDNVPPKTVKSVSIDTDDE